MKHGYIRCSLRSSLIFAGLFVAALGIFLFFFRDTIQERMAVYSLRRLGYEVELSAPPLEELEPILGNVGFLGIKGDRPFDDEAMELAVHFHKLRALSIWCESIEPGVLHRLGELQALQIFSVVGVNIDDRGLTGMGSAVGLKKLLIQETAIQGTVLTEVSSMKAIELLWLADNSRLGNFHTVDLKNLDNVVKINLARTAIRGDCLGWVPNCKYLYLSDTSAGDETIQKLSRCTRLETIDLSKTCVTGQGLKRFDLLPHLRELKLSNCPISDKSLENIQFLKSLRVLDLGGTPITDSGLDHLCEATQLVCVTLVHCPHISPSGIARLRQSLASTSARDAAKPEVFTRSADGEGPE